MGIFTVRKKDGAQRLILDARQANACHRTPASLAALDLSAQTLEADGFGGVLGDDDPQVTAESGDVGDCFYNFAIPELTAWFCTEDAFARQELQEELGIDVSMVFDDDYQKEIPLKPGEKVFCAFKGVPTGWSWALYFANEIVCHQVAKSSARPGHDEIRDRRPPPQLLPGQTVVGTYVDNVHVFGGQLGTAGTRMKAISEHLDELGILFVVDGVEGQPYMDSLGLRLSFERGRYTAMAKPARAWTLWHATRGLLRRRRLSGELLQVYLGLANFHFQLMRPALSIFSACYKFAAESLGRRKTVWPSVRSELRLALGLVFLVEFDMSAPVCSEVHIGDSSDRGYGMLATDAARSELRRALRHQEKWRFIQTMEPDLSADPERELGEGEWLGFRGSTPHSGLGRDALYGRELAAKADEAYTKLLFKQRRARLLKPPLPKSSTIVQGPSIPPLDSSWDAPERWRLISSGPWTRVKERINIKEARVCLMSLRRLCRTSPHCGTTALTLSDSLVFCLALEKGRSSSAGLNGVCRRAAAYQIACRIQWRLRRIETDRNFADAPSRQWGPDIERKGYTPKKRRMDIDDVTQGIRVGADLEGLGPTTATPSSSSTAPLLSSPSVSPSTTATTTARTTYFLEVFSGTARLTEAVARHGLRVLPDVEVGKGHQFDMLRPTSQQIILDLIRDGRVWAVHFGTPCTVWSRARHNLKNLRRARQKEAAGVALALFTARAIRLCIACNVFFSLENPQTSRLWEFGPIHDILKNPKTHFFVLHMCGWGTPYKKPTAILTNMLALKQLIRKCTRDHEHVALRGSERVVVDGKVCNRNRATGAGAYPPLLCDAWARVLQAQGPVGSQGHAAKDDVVTFLNGLETAAARAHRHLAEPARGALQTGNDLADSFEPYLNDARKYIRSRPVIFGHFTAADIADLVGYHKLAA